MQDIVNSVFKKINEQDKFLKISIYVMGGFVIVMVGYSVGRLVGSFVF